MNKNYRFILAGIIIMMSSFVTEEFLIPTEIKLIGGVGLILFGVIRMMVETKND